MNSPITMHDKKLLRQHFRSQRQHLTASQQRTAELTLVEHIIHSQWFNDSRHMACYLANDGEIGTQTLIEHIWQKSKLCYLPVLPPASNKEMRFAQYQRNMQLKKNQLNILEPPWHEPTLHLPENLDVVFLPLLAFDEQGHRLGMGAGYYDRHFAFRQHMNTQPLLIGLAHEIQKAESLPVEPWDVSLDIIITDQKVRHINP